METRGDTLVTSSFCVIIAHVRVVFRMSTSNNARRPRWNEFSLEKEKGGGGGGGGIGWKNGGHLLSLLITPRVCFSPPPLLKKNKKKKEIQ